MNVIWRADDGWVKNGGASPPAAAEAELWASPDFSRVSMPPGFPDALRRAAKRFLNEYRSQLQPFEMEYEVAPGGLLASLAVLVWGVGPTSTSSLSSVERRMIRAMSRARHAH